MAALVRLGTPIGRPVLACLSGVGSRLSLHGEVDVTGSADVTRVLLDATADVSGDVVLDLSGLEFLDVAGARALVGAVRLLAERGATVRLAGARRGPARCLELFGLTSEPGERA